MIIRPERHKILLVRKRSNTQYELIEGFATTMALYIYVGIAFHSEALDPSAAYHCIMDVGRNRWEIMELNRDHPGLKQPEQINLFAW